MARANGRERLLTAARDELISGGGALEVAPLAERAGLSVGLLYRHFGSKAGLAAAVVEDFFDRHDAAVMDLNPAPGADWATRERLRTELTVDFHYRDPLAAVVLSRLAREPEVAAVEAERIARHVRLAARNIELGQRDGELPADLDAGLVGAMVLGGIRQVLIEALSRRRRPGRDVLVDELWRFIVAAVRWRPAS
jgi:AcrR family transcriptional regulator